MSGNRPKTILEQAIEQLCRNERGRVVAGHMLAMLDDGVTHLDKPNRELAMGIMRESFDYPESTRYALRAALGKGKS